MLWVEGADSRDLMQVNILERPGLILTDRPATEWARIGGGGFVPAFQGQRLTHSGMASWRVGRDGVRETAPP
jgi:hypothetical protein